MCNKRAKFVASRAVESLPTLRTQNQHSKQKTILISCCTNNYFISCGAWSAKIHVVKFHLFGFVGLNTNRILWSIIDSTRTRTDTLYIYFRHKNVAVKIVVNVVISINFTRGKFHCLNLSFIFLLSLLSENFLNREK